MLLQDSLAVTDSVAALRDSSAVDSLAAEVVGAVIRAAPALRTVAPHLQDTTRVAAPAAKPVKPPVVPGGLWERIVSGVDGVIGLGPVITADLLLTLLVVFLLWALRTLVLAAVRRRSTELTTLYRWRKGTTYGGVVIGLLILVPVWVGAFTSVATFLGLLTAGVAIALKDPLVNVVGWFYILWRRPLSPGDRITIRTHTGDVIDQRVFMFTMLQVGTPVGAEQSTGRIIHIPNGWIFSDSVVNHTSEFAYVWHEVPVIVTFESDWREAKRRLLEIAQTCTDPLSEDAERALRSAAREYFIFYAKLTPTVYTSVVERGIRLTLRYLVPPRQVRGSEQAVWEAVLDAFAGRDDIALAYPTTRFVRGGAVPGGEGDR